MVKENIMEKLSCSTDDDFESMLICAVRYCLGRRTYMPGVVISFIRPLLSNLSSKTLVCLKRDIEEAERFGNLGDEKVDKPLWISFLKEIEEERKRR